MSCLIFACKLIVSWSIEKYEVIFLSAFKYDNDKRCYIKLFQLIYFLLISRCQKCSGGSVRCATFYELDLSIKGHSTLGASIKDFLQVRRIQIINFDLL